MTGAAHEDDLPSNPCLGCDDPEPGPNCIHRPMTANVNLPSNAGEVQIFSDAEEAVLKAIDGFPGLDVAASHEALTGERHEPTLSSLAKAAREYEKASRAYMAMQRMGGHRNPGPIIDRLSASREKLQALLDRVPK